MPSRVTPARRTATPAASGSGNYSFSHYWRNANDTYRTSEVGSGSGTGYGSGGYTNHTWGAYNSEKAERLGRITGAVLF